MPAKSVVPCSWIKREVPRGSPTWPASRWSKDEVPVEVVRRPSSGEGLRPGASCLCAAGCDGAAWLVWAVDITVFRFLKDIANVRCAPEVHLEFLGCVYINSIVISAVEDPGEPKRAGAVDG